MLYVGALGTISFLSTHATPNLKGLECLASYPFSSFDVLDSQHLTFIPPFSVLFKLPLVYVFQ